MTRVFGLVGNPVAHSLSPRMHGAWIAEAGLDAVYVPLEAHPDTTGAAIVDALRTLGIAGVNLTVPFKQRVVHHLDALGPVATRTGAVNTIVVHEGRLIGSNTDAPGFVAGVEEAGVSLKGQTVLVLGAGGAARAVAVGVADAGASRVVVLNRTTSRAETVAEELSTACPNTRFEAGGLDRFAALASSAALIVMAVSREGRSAIATLDPFVVPTDTLWVDLNYWDPSPPLVPALQARGVRIQDGLPMLIHQGALAFEAFTGRPADPIVAQRLLRGGMHA